MENLIGTFAKADWRGRSVYGMVISKRKVCGENMVGFAFADPTQWVAFLTKPEEIVKVAEPEEVAKAIESATSYWLFELNSLRQRAAMHYAEDDEKELRKLIKTAADWCAKLEVK